MTPSAELDGEILHQTQVALKGKLMAQLIRRLNPKLYAHGSTLIFINHIQDVIGGGGYGPRKTTPGGRSLKYYASVRVELQKIETMRSKLQELESGTVSEQQDAIRVRATVQKSKVGVPFRRASFIIRPPYGISDMETVVDVATKAGLLKQAGSYYTLPDGKTRVQGRAKLYEHLGSNLSDYRELRDSVVENMEDRLRAQKEQSIKPSYSPFRAEPDP